MSLPTSRQELIEWGFRKLGHPVIQINVAQIQAEDRADEALAMYREFHADGATRTFLKHQLTQQDIDNKYLIIPQEISTISKLYSVPSLGSMSGLFSFQYQFFMNDFYSGGKYMPSGALANYAITMNYLAEFDFFFNFQKSISFNRNTNRLEIYEDWSKFRVGEYLIFDSRVVVDTATATKLWSDNWFREYFVCLLELQWANNLRKIKNVAGIGGAMIDVDSIERSAKTTKKELEASLKTQFTEPPMFFVG